MKHYVKKIMTFAILLIALLCPIIIMAAEAAAQAIPVAPVKSTTSSILDMVLTAAVTALVWIARLAFAKPKWAQYEGMMITAVKFAEKAIPDNSTNTTMQRTNAAMQSFISQYAAQTGKPAPDSLLNVVAQGMPIVHAKLEAAGNI